MLRSLFAGAALVAIAVPAVAQAPRSQRVQFAKGATSATIKDMIKGDDSIDYLVGARVGQTISVTLKTSNASSYFNVLAPGAGDVAMPDAAQRTDFRGRLPANGDYRIRVYLMRNAARRNEVANYTLTVGVAAQAPAASAMPAGSGSPVTPGNMPAYCRGEASGQYGTRPAYVKTGAMAKAPGGGTYIDGTVDKGSEGIKRFRCRYDARAASST